MTKFILTSFTSTLPGHVSILVSMTSTVLSRNKQGENYTTEVKAMGEKGRKAE